MLQNGVTVTGFILSDRVLIPADRRKAMIDDLFTGFSDGSYKPVIDKVFPFGDLKAAYAHMASNVQFGKIVVKI